VSWFYRTLIRPALFAQEAEQVHQRTMRALGWASRRPLVCQAVESIFSASSLPVEIFGLSFPNPIGLAAGMDKYAEAVPMWKALGFGFAELGAVTWHAQPGNPSPRLFRVVPDEAIINRMGFNNPGAEAFAERLATWRASGRWPNHPVGINLGKSKITPLEKAAEDYAHSFRLLWEHLDFFVVNVSSPNTPNLRQLQDKAALGEIFSALREVEAQKMEAARKISSASANRGPKPLLVKVAPDLTFEALDEILEVAHRHQIAGIVAANTTIARPQTDNSRARQIYSEAGGLSGRPLRARSTEVIRHLYRQTKGALPIIGVGGVFNASDAWEKITSGASLVQVYTGLIYEGPSIVKAIVKGLLERLEEAGLKSLQQAVGTRAGKSR
jgi:dihydroorotate dehydrogenase